MVDAQAHRGLHAFPQRQSRLPKQQCGRRELRGIALGRKSWLFAGSDRGGVRAAIMLTLIQSAKLNDVDPQAWLADVLAQIADHKITGLAALLPWNWRKPMPSRAEAA
jgi:transposase